MNPSPLVQTAGNVCVGLAALVFLFPLRRLVSDYAKQFLSDDRWAMPVLGALVPVWLLLMVALLCMTASGGFDSLRLSRAMLHAFSVGASVALATVTFVFIALHIRPGFTPREIYVPGIYLTPFATGLLVVLSLNPRLAPGLPIQWLRWPWTVFAAVSLFVCVAFVGHRLVTTGFGVRQLVRQFLWAREAAAERLVKIANINPQDEDGFLELFDLTDRKHDRKTREAAMARLRGLPDLSARLTAILEKGVADHEGMEAAMHFLEAFKLTPEEQKRIAPALRTALERFINAMPPPSQTNRENREELLQWGRRSIPVIIGKFTGTEVDFSGIMPSFEQALRPDDTRR